MSESLELRLGEILCCYRNGGGVGREQGKEGRREAVPRWLATAQGFEGYINTPLAAERQASIAPAAAADSSGDSARRWKWSYPADNTGSTVKKHRHPRGFTPSVPCSQHLPRNDWRARSSRSSEQIGCLPRAATFGCLRPTDTNSPATLEVLFFHAIARCRSRPSVRFGPG